MLGIDLVMVFPVGTNNFLFYGVLGNSTAHVLSTRRTEQPAGKIF